MTSPSDSQYHESRPFPCPECTSTKGYSRVGKYRSQCKNCNALLKNSEINLEDQEPQ
jgi:ribosomal protein L37AE/L43A